VSERLTRLCDYAIEGGLLLTVLAVPVYMNLGDVRVFEPDKAILLRDAAAVLGVLALLRLAFRTLPLPSPARRAAGPALARPPRRASLPGALIDAARRRPTVLPMGLLALVTALAAAASILPDVSWNGSYARGQGVLTLGAYLIVALLVATLTRHAAQARRLGAAIALSGFLPAAYGWVQHAGRDPLPWQQADLAARVPGTLGNPIFLGALLVMTIPLALWRLVLAVEAARSALARRDGPRARGVRAALILAWGAVAVVEGGGLLFTRSRGPFAGLLVALVVFGLALAHARALPWLRRAATILGVGAILVLLAANLWASGAGRAAASAPRVLRWAPATSDSSEVRLLIWRPALDLVARRPVLGCGLDTLMTCYYPVYPTPLRHIEAPNAVPDRMHNILLDAAAETGLLGLGALLVLLGVTARTLLRLTRRAAHSPERALAAALLAALLGHVAEGLFGIAIVSTLLLTWAIAGLAAALTALDQNATTAAEGQQESVAFGRRRGWVSTLRRPVLALPFVAAFAPALTAPPAARPLGARTPSRGTSVAPAPAAARASSVPRLGWAARYAWVTTILAFALCGGAVIGAGAVIVSGVTATAADAAARQGADLSAAAQVDSGQSAPPPGTAARPVVGLREFAAAARLQDDAMRLAPGQEEYDLDAGMTMVAWADAAVSIGGMARVEAPALYRRSLLLFGRAARLNSGDPDPLRDTAKAYERWAGLGRDPAAPQTWDQTLLARAAGAFARAAALAPRHPDPLTGGAQVALWQGQPARARQLAGQALALDPRDGDGWRLRAEAAFALGDRQDALASWRRALADPTVAQRGPTAARLALAEATWAHARCAAVRDTQAALATGELDAQDASRMGEILHVDAPLCRASISGR